MTPVSVHNEWDSLEEVIVGRIDDGPQLPAIDPTFKSIEFPDWPSDTPLPFKAYPDQVVEETAEDLETLCETLRSLGISVRRPNSTDHTAQFRTPDWRAEGTYNYCPRDVLLAVGNTLIETPMVSRARYFEPLAYKSLCIEYMRAGARWISAPKPALDSRSYALDKPSGQKLLDVEPVFDAANVLRAGKDIFYLVSDSGNRLGAQWLASTLGADYRVHLCENMYASTHVDSTLVLLRDGLLLANPARVTADNLPDALRNWTVLNAPEMKDIGCVTGLSRASTWIGMNLLSVRPDLAIVDAAQVELHRLLERHGIDVIPMSLRHARALGGGFHCVTLDIRRTSQDGSGA